jgi:drug/metabolite transporter (DMT)-like permease
MMKPSRKSYIQATITILFWGTTFAISKLVLNKPLNPITFTAIRSLLGFVILFLFLAIKGEIKAWLKVLKKHFPNFLIIGAGLYSFAYIVQYWGISSTFAMNQAIISNTQTFWVVIINLIVFKKKPKPRFVLGAILAFVGVLFVLMNDQFQLSTDTLKGDIISIFAFILWGAYTAFSKPISTKEKPFYVTTSIIFCANLLLIPLSIGLGGIEETSLLTVEQWGIMFYLGFFCIGLTFILWTSALSEKTVPSENIALLSMLNPVVGIITAILLLSEVFTSQIIIGTLIIFIGLLISESNPKQKLKENSGKNDKFENPDGISNEIPNENKSYF